VCDVFKDDSGVVSSVSVCIALEFDKKARWKEALSFFEVGNSFYGWRWGDSSRLGLKQPYLDIHYLLLYVEGHYSERFQLPRIVEFTEQFIGASERALQHWTNVPVHQ